MKRIKNQKRNKKIKSNKKEINYSKLNLFRNWKRTLQILLFPFLISIISLLFYYSIFSLDSLEDNLILLALGDDTSYSKGFNEKKFKEINLGESKNSVVNRIGYPIFYTYVCKSKEESYYYIETDNKRIISSDLTNIRFDDDINKLCPTLDEVYWKYTLNKGNRRIRIIVFDENSKVKNKIAGSYID